MSSTMTEATESPASEDRYSCVAVLIPCYNEEATVTQVVADFRNALPGAAVYVFDNNSTDRTADLAREAGAVVVRSPRQGKGHVVQHMFEHVDAETYIMIDGDGTYPAAEAQRLVEMQRSTGCDMLVGTRLSAHGDGSFRPLHYLGNRMISGVISKVFNVRVTDVLSGYRVFSRDFVKLLPLVSPGFEIETELTLQAVAKKFIIRETEIKYGERPAHSPSKLSTFKDGWKILRTIVLILKDYKPLTFFGSVAILFAILSLAAGAMPILDFIRLRAVPHFPLAILAASLSVISAIAASIGLVLHTICVYQAENYQLWKMHYKRGRQSDVRSSV
jgi:glycosyltransferase involved in cell wall biosynthesis